MLHKYFHEEIGSHSKLCIQLHTPLTTHRRDCKTQEDCKRHVLLHPYWRSHASTTEPYTCETQLQLQPFFSLLHPLFKKKSCEEDDEEDDTMNMMNLTVLITETMTTN